MMIKFKDYLALCKPKVVLLMLITALVGMLLAPKATRPISTLCLAQLGIALTASAGAIMNHFIDRQFDAHMMRTKNRPLPQGKIKPAHALVFAFILGGLGLFVLIIGVNALTAWLTLASLAGYACIYTIFLKRTTPQNIVIGGLAGATPPLLGWSAMTGHIHAYALILVMIIFTWTPPHFWALAIYRYQDYKKVEIPMLPITHGIPFTKFAILLYTLLMITTTLLPFCTHMSGWIYFYGAVFLNIGFLWQVGRLCYRDKSTDALKTFRYSISYLGALFSLLLLDHFLNPIL